MGARNSFAFNFFRTLSIVMGVYTPYRPSTLSAHNCANRTLLPLLTMGAILKVI
jgi:hypothetical protein